MVNSDLTINEFSMEIHNVTKKYSIEMMGKYEKAKLQIEYEPLETVILFIIRI